MRRFMTAMTVLVTIGLAAGDEKAAPGTFGKADADKLPAGWTAAQTGKGKSEWKVVPDETAPGKTGFALAQTTADKGALFNLCVAAEPVLEDVEVSVAFKAV